MVEVRWLRQVLICILIQVQLSHTLPFGWRWSDWQDKGKDWIHDHTDSSGHINFRGDSFAIASFGSTPDTTTPVSPQPPAQRPSPMIAAVIASRITPQPAPNTVQTANNVVQTGGNTASSSSQNTQQAAPAVANAVQNTTPSTIQPGTPLAAAVVTSAAPASGGVFAEFSSLDDASASAVVTAGTPSGIINTIVPTNGQPTQNPLPSATFIPAFLSPTSVSLGDGPATRIAASANIFVPVATDAPPSNIPSRNGHPEQGVGLVHGHSEPVETNKFYTNMLIGDQTGNVFTYPYSVHWGGGQGAFGYGLVISHIERDQTVFGPGNPPEYFINPLGLASLILTSTELEKGSKLTTDSHAGFSVNVNLAQTGSSERGVTFPLVQGMSFITGIYTASSVLIKSGYAVKQLSSVTKVGSSYRWIALLNDGHLWAIYLTPNGNTVPTLALAGDGSSLQGPSGYSGLVQVAKLENQGDETTYDKQVGVYPVSGSVAADASGSYSITWQKKGDTSKSIMMFALPHHLESFAADTKSKVLSTFKLTTPAKGDATLVQSDQWNFAESLPSTMGFAPWSPTVQGVKALSDTAKQFIAPILTSELNQDIAAKVNDPSVYFSGKAFTKYAQLVYIAHDLIPTTGIANAALLRLEAALDSFMSSKFQATLTYDNDWKGIINSAGYTQREADFGNPMYNDHMFHYGYFVYTAAVIAYLDPAWVTRGSNKAWVNALIRDYANSIENDAYFPFSRNFDWYHGHSWAGGLHVSGDGKDLESSSEDSFSLYAIKMWGLAIGDKNMESRGNLMLAVQARSLNNYFLMQSSNKVQPSKFIPNKASGILFENKVHHTTYFGTQIEYIQGIHMIPMGPQSGLTRQAQFIKEEWSTYFSNGRVDAMEGGWRSIIYANYALVDPKAAWAYFTRSDFDPVGWLDGGGSRSWYLTMAAMLGGA